MDALFMEDVFKLEPEYSFSCNISVSKNTSYCHIAISQLYNTVYIGYPHIKSILAFDLEGNYLYCFKIVIPKIILGKFCQISENILCVSELHSRVSRAHLITNEGILITTIMYGKYSRRIIDCFSSEKHQIFYIVSESGVDSFGKEGMQQIEAINNFIQPAKTIKGICIKDDDMNLVLRVGCRWFSFWYIYYAQENRLDEIQINIEQFNDIVAFQDYIIFTDNEYEGENLAICNLHSKNVKYIDEHGRACFTTRKIGYHIRIHIASRKLYTKVIRGTVVKVYNLDDLLRMYEEISNKVSESTVDDKECEDYCNCLYHMF
ncbi:hypothetical protein LOD99_9894 [Oopsacas minuta]|uniref:Uncharacterized protein n=1 Tax=Oopsacas minuta TaxID=111878 RepID=A0AAV7KJU1_9METZ|nr:hypothetical protein LOD99_9894 [Oopsacas minuta]